MTSAEAAWPALPLARWRDTRDTLHLWTQIVGKVRLALASPVNHWWHVPLYVTARGLTTSPMPIGGGSLEIRFDFVDHALWFETSRGEARRLALEPRSVADFYGAVRRALRDLELAVRVWPHPVEIADATPFDRDERHGAYDAAAANAFWLVLTRVALALQRFRAGFLGKASPVHFWWGSFDLSCTRFSGRRAPPHPGGVPNCPDYVTREAYSHECISAGWWPGGGERDAECYAYAYPEPEGFAGAAVTPGAARYDRDAREWVLPHEAARTAPDADAAVQSFFLSTYEAGASLARWDRAALERT